jgi:hypothetical protein
MQFHTGLRKGCDSLWSALVYGLIPTLPKKLWWAFIDLCRKETDGITNRVELASKLHFVLTNFDFIDAMGKHAFAQTWHHYKREKQSLGSAFETALHMMPVKDAESLACWFLPLR